MRMTSKGQVTIPAEIREGFRHPLADEKRYRIYFPKLTLISP